MHIDIVGVERMGREATGMRERGMNAAGKLAIWLCPQLLAQACFRSQSNSCGAPSMTEITERVSCRSMDFANQRRAYMQRHITCAQQEE